MIGVLIFVAVVATVVVFLWRKPPTPGNPGGPWK